MKVEIGDMEEKLDTLMSRAPPVGREPGMEGKIRCYILRDLGSQWNIVQAINCG